MSEQTIETRKPTYEEIAEESIRRQLKATIDRRAVPAGREPARRGPAKGDIEKKGAGRRAARRKGADR